MAYLPILRPTELIKIVERSAAQDTKEAFLTSWLISEAKQGTREPMQPALDHPWRFPGEFFNGKPAYSTYSWWRKLANYWQLSAPAKQRLEWLIFYYTVGQKNAASPAYMKRPTYVWEEVAP